MKRQDNYPIHQDIPFRSRDFIPLYGLYKYMKRNERRGDLSSYTLREGALFIYDLLASQSIILGLFGLEQLLH